MAVWEANFAVIPTGHFPTDFEAQLDQIAPRIAHWSAEAVAWGEPDSSRIELWIERGELKDGSLRIDMREPNDGFIRGVLAFLQSIDFGLEDETGEWVSPDPPVFAQSLRRSRAVRFLQDPELYLRRVSLGGWQDA